MSRYWQAYQTSWWLSIVILMITPLTWAQPPASIGQVVRLQGQVSVQHQGHTTAEPLTRGSPLYLYDRIQTQAESKVALTLVDGTVLSLGEQSTITISESVYSPQAQQQKSVISLLRGVFRAIVTKVLPRSTFEVHTPTAIAAVRGTDWLARVTSDHTAVAVLQGEVRVQHTRSEFKGEVALNPGMGTDVRSNAPPTPAKTWKPARLNRLIQATQLP